MKAIILAAGRGSRMGALTDDRPKCLINLRGKPLLEWQIDALRGAGVGEIAAVRGYRGEMLIGRGLTLFDNPRWESTNMVTSLACAADWLRDEPCLVSYGDIFYSVKAARSLLDSNVDIGITYDVNWRALWARRFDDILSDAETFRIDHEHRILDIGKKARSVEQIQGQYMGLLRFTPQGWGDIEQFLQALPPADRDRLSMTEMLQRLIERGTSIHGVPVTDPWGEVDSTADLVLYESLLSSAKHESTRAGG